MSKIKMIKIIDLVKIFLSDSYKNIDIIDTKKQALNKKSILLWMMVILLVAITFISNKVIKFLVLRGQSEIFLNLYFLLLSILLMFQTILVCVNIFYFSKDLEFVLPLPIHPIELLIAKYVTLLFKLYISEMIFGLIPMFIYGINTDAPFLLYFYVIVVLILFPIFLSLLVSIVMMFLMKTSKFIKNKEIFQIIITLTLMLLLVMVEYKIIGKIVVETNQMEKLTQEEILEEFSELNKRIRESNKYFLVINPSVDTILNANGKSILPIFKLIFIDIAAFSLFVFIGKCTYLKYILKNTTYIINYKKIKTELKTKCKKRNIRKSYILKENKTLFRNSMSFIQCVYPIATWLITIIITGITIKPKIEMVLKSEEFIKEMGELSVDLTMVYLILGIIQLLFMTSTASLTAISREGKNAAFIKYIPIPLYKQFVYKAIPQILINTIAIVVVLVMANYLLPILNWYHTIPIFILSMLLNIINSYSMLCIDLLRPKLNWDTEYDILKQNNNKIFQYVFAVLVIIFLVYLSKVLEGIDLYKAMFITGIVFTVIILIIKFVVKARQKDLFDKIN